DPIAFGHQYIDHVAGHAGGDVTRFGRVPTGLAANVTNELIELLEDYFFRHTIHAQVEVAGAVPFDAHTGDIDTVTFPVYVDHDLGGHALGGSGLAVTVRDRQQDFGLERTGGALLEELAPDIGEHGEGQHVLLALGQAADLLAQAVHFRLEQIRRAHLDHVLIANGAHLQLGVDGARCLAIAALQVQLHLVGDGLVALPGQHVEYRLGADDLRGGGDQRREAEVLAHPRNFLEDLVDPVERALFLQLVGQVGHHAARHLVDLHPGIHAGEGALELVIFLAHFHEIHA